MTKVFSSFPKSTAAPLGVGPMIRLISTLVISTLRLSDGVAERKGGGPGALRVPRTFVLSFGQIHRSAYLPPVEKAGR